jgi:hypothetical protein
MNYINISKKKIKNNNFYINSKKFFSKIKKILQKNNLLK